MSRFCAELRHGVAEHFDSTPLSLFVLPVRIHDAELHGHQRKQSASPGFCFASAALSSALENREASIASTVFLFLGRTRTPMTHL
ncbi:hypothetical protein TNCV_1933211 [Trichonephila clavipes]|nr:hypothetical protein TNCV_1933211 [Trichonephila clavipes]